jgi:hypothetical protein
VRLELPARLDEVVAFLALALAGQRALVAGVELPAWNCLKNTALPRPERPFRLPARPGCATIGGVAPEGRPMRRRRDEDAEAEYADLADDGGRGRAWWRGGAARKLLIAWGALTLFGLISRASAGDWLMFALSPLIAAAIVVLALPLYLLLRAYLAYLDRRWSCRVCGGRIRRVSYPTEDGYVLCPYCYDAIRRRRSRRATRDIG